MAWRIDWGTVHDQWETLNEGRKETIKTLLKGLSDEELEKLFKQSPSCKALYTKVIGPWVPRVEWSKELEKRLRDLFEATLTRGLPEEGLRGISPRRYMAEYRRELLVVKGMRSEEDMQRYVEMFAMDILRREAKPPVRIRIPRIPTPPSEVPDEEVPYVEYAPVELPMSPRSLLPFPRSPSVEERDLLYEAYSIEMAMIGARPWFYEPTFNDWIARFTFKSWADVLEQFKAMITIIKDEEAKEYKDRLIKIPFMILRRVPMPWSEIPEMRRRDAVVHLTATKQYPTMMELLEAVFDYEVPSPEELMRGEPKVTPEEAKKYIKEAWKDKDIWFTSVSKEFLEALIEEPVE